MEGGDMGDMSGFQVGDEVVCVDASEKDLAISPPYMWAPWDSPLVQGWHYVVRWSGLDDEGDAVVKLVGVRETSVGDDGLLASRFRKINRKNTELFRDMCKSKKPLVPVGTMV